MSTIDRSAHKTVCRRAEGFSPSSSEAERVGERRPWSRAFGGGVARVVELSRNSDKIPIWRLVGGARYFVDGADRKAAIMLESARNFAPRDNSRFGISSQSQSTVAPECAFRPFFTKNCSCFTRAQLLYCALFFERKLIQICDVQKALKPRNPLPSGSRSPRAARFSAPAPGAGIWRRPNGPNAAVAFGVLLVFTPRTSIALSRASHFTAEAGQASTFY
jgi:hypothetical protein